MMGAQVIVPPGSAAAPSNPLSSLEIIGDVASGGTLLTGGTANNLGSWVNLGTTAAAWNNASVAFYQIAAGANRFLIDISIDGQVTTLFDKLFLQPSTGAGPAMVPLPMEIPAGAVIAMRVRSNTASATLRAIVFGEVPSNSQAPGHTIADLLTTASTAATSPSTSSVTVASSITWTPLVASLPNDYTGFLLTLGSTTTPGTSQQTIVRLAIGPAFSEVVMGAAAHPLQNSTSANGRFSRYFKFPGLTGERLSMSVFGATPGDSVSPCLFGLRR